MAYDGATERLFLAAFSKGSLEVIDLKQGKLIKTFSGIPEAQGVAVAPADKRVFVAGGGDGVLHAYDTGSLQSSGSVFAIDDADNVRYDARHRRVLVGGGSETQGGVVSFDPQTLAKAGEVPLPSHAESFQCDPSGPRLFVNVPGGRLLGQRRNRRPCRPRQKLGFAKMAIAGYRTQLPHGPRSVAWPRFCRQPQARSRVGARSGQRSRVGLGGLRGG